LLPPIRLVGGFSFFPSCLHAAFFFFSLFFCDFFLASHSIIGFGFPFPAKSLVLFFFLLPNSLVIIFFSGPLISFRPTFFGHAGFFGFFLGGLFFPSARFKNPRVFTFGFRRIPSWNVKLSFFCPSLRLFFEEWLHFSFSGLRELSNARQTFPRLGTIRPALLPQRLLFRCSVPSLFSCGIRKPPTFSFFFL